MKRTNKIFFLVIISSFLLLNNYAFAADTVVIDEFSIYPDQASSPNANAGATIRATVDKNQLQQICGGNLNGKVGYHIYKNGGAFIDAETSFPVFINQQVKITAGDEFQVAIGCPNPSMQVVVANRVVKIKSCTTNCTIPTKFKCNASNQCVPDVNGTYTTPSCDNKCSPSTGDKTKGGETGSYQFTVPNWLKGGATNITDLINIITDWIFNLSMPIAVMLIIYAGVLYLTAGAVTANVTKARNVLTYTVLGLAIIFIGKGFITLIESILTLGSGPTTSQPPGGGTGETGKSSCVNGKCELDPNGQYPDTFCSNVCNVSGPIGDIGSLCTSSNSCKDGLTCGSSQMCQQSGGNTEGQPCLVGQNCQSGMRCDLTPPLTAIDGRQLGKCQIENL